MEYSLGQDGVAGGEKNDLISVTGDLVLDGVLDVLAEDGFGSGTYRLIDFTGTLTDNGLEIGVLPTGFAGEILVAAGQVNLLAKRYGDASGDDYVNDDDLALMLTHWKQADAGWTSGDFSGDGLVNDDDLALMLTYWKQGVPPAGSTVPEPATLSLLALGALAMRRRRR
jgi:hypothetical protein